MRTLRTIAAVAAVVAGTGITLAQDGDRSLRTANALLARGLHEDAAAEYESALRSLDQAVARDEARYGLALARYSLGDDARALSVLQGLESGSRFPLRADADVLRLHALFRLKQYTQAAQAAQTAIAHRDHAVWPQTASLLIESLHRSGRHELAAEAYETLGNRIEADANAYRRASLLAGLSKSAVARREADHALAADWLARAIPLRERDELGDLAMLERAKALRRAGRAEDAVNAYIIAINRGGSSVQPEALLSLGTLLRAQGDSDGAIEALRTLIGRHRDHQPARAHLELGLALLDQGEPKEASRALDTAQSRLADRDTEIADDIAYWRAKADLRQDRPADAAKRLATAIEQHGRSEIIAEMRYDHAVALERTGDALGAARAFASFTQAHGEHPLAADALYAQSSLALAAGKIQEAESLAARFLDDHGHHALADKARFLRGEARYLQGKHEIASTDFAALLDANDAELAKSARYRLGMSLHALGRVSDAATHLRAVTDGARTRSELAPALFTLADIEAAQGQWASAERGYAHYLEIASDGDEAADDAAMKLALAQLRQGKSDQAIQTLTNLLDTWPRSEHASHARFELGQAYALAGQDDRASRQFESLISADARSRFVPHALRHLAAIAARRGDARVAADLYARAAEAGGQSMAELVAVDRARSLINAGSPELAARVLEGMSGPARGWRVIALSRAERHDEAVTLAAGFDAEALPEPDRGVYRYALATGLRATGQIARASTLLASLSNSDSTVSAAAAFDLADIYLADKRYADAAALLEPLAESDPAAAYQAAWARYQMGDHRLVVDLLEEQRFEDDLAGPAAMLAGESMLALKRGRDAAAQFSKAIEAGGKGVDAEAALLRLGEAHATAQDWRQSQRAYERHRADHPRSPRWYMAEFGLGWSLENGGKPREAMVHYRSVADKHKGDTAARAQFQIGECLFALGEHEQAVRELLRVDILHASPEWSAAALYEAGRCYEAMDKIGEARAQYRAVQDRFGDSDWATAAGERLRAIAAPGGTRTPTSGRGG